MSTIFRRRKRVTVRITKRCVVIRDRCHCFANKKANFAEPLPISKACFVNEPPFSYVIWVAALSFIIRVLLFIYFHE